MQELGLQNELIQYHCIVHQRNLIGKGLGYKQIMCDIVNAVNFIRSCGLNHRQFKAFLDEIKSEYGDTVYYSEVCWLSKSKVLQRLLSLLEEIKVFLIEREQPVSHSEDESWICDLAFLTDICGHMTDLNSKLQGKC
jgi:hypothetical protein